MIEKVTIKYDGTYQEIEAGLLDMSRENPRDSEIIQAVSSHLNASSLTEFVVEPPFSERDSTTTVVALRPTATYGI